MIYIDTYTGKQFFLAPQVSAELVDIRDIAHGLANSCRFAGQCDRFYSVAEHSVLVSRRVPEGHALWGLLHDAAEAYLGPTPDRVKDLLPNIRVLEARIQMAVASRFRLVPQLKPPSEVRLAEQELLMDELVAAMGGGGKLRGGPVRFLTPALAERQFLARWEQLQP